EETLFGPPASMMHTNEPDFHYGRSADDDEQPAARPQHPYEVLVELGHGARYRDRVELGGVVERHRVRSMDLDVDVGHLGELRARRLDRVRKVLDADDLAGEPCETGREIAAAGADLEHAIARFELQRLQRPTLDLGRHHPLAVRQR